MKKLLISYLFVLQLYMGLPLHAQNTERKDIPSDTKMIQASRDILSYLDTIYQKKQIGAMRLHSQAKRVKEITGKYPAFVEEDLCGWKTPRWNSEYHSIVQQSINNIKTIWNGQGAIPGMSWHWGNPLYDGGRYPDTKVKLSPEQFNNIVTKGTSEYNLMMDDLEKHADYLHQLANLDIPLVWRPLHEIDGGWFWWTDEDNPENTVKLWKIIYDYLVDEREFHNLIWVYCAGQSNPNKKSAEVKHMYYPGDEWCDMVGIDLYDVDYKNTGIREFWDASQTYKEAYDIMHEMAQNKMIMLGECEAMPNVNKTYSDDPNFAQWLWDMPWYCDTDKNPHDWVMETYTHRNVIMQPELFKSIEIITGSNKAVFKNGDQLASIYPVPNTGEFNIRIPNCSNPIARIYDTNGNLLLEQSIKSSETNLITDFKPGVYLVKVISEERLLEKAIVLE